MVEYSGVPSGIPELTTTIVVIVPTIRCGESSANMSENAFDPTNIHLWARCRTHENDPLAADNPCIFVEDCVECEEYCRHDWHDSE